MNLLQNIYNLQVKTPEKYYQKGMFRSQRTHPCLPIVREDDNIFFTAQIVFILQSLAKYFSHEDRKLLEEITNNALENYSAYCNTSEPRTYNFWQKKASMHFPNGFLLRKFKKFSLPDDVDDTAMVYLAHAHSAEELIAFKEKLILHTNNAKLTVQNSKKAYKHLKAYSTWLGKKMPVELDVCVLCNLMYLIYKHELPLNVHDADTLLFIEGVIAEREYMTDSFRVAPTYIDTAIILYHITRLMGTFNIPSLDIYRDTLIKDITALFQTSKDEMQRVILSTSLLRLGGTRLKVDMPKSFRFNWFTAGMLSVYGNPILQKMAPNSLFHFKFNCEAFNLTLVLENSLL